MAQAQQRNTSNTRRRQAAAPLEPIEGKQMPQAIEFERAILGAVMIETEAYGTVAEILRPDSFYEPKHQKIYEAIVNLSTKERPIDVLTVMEQLKANGTLTEIGGPTYLAELTNSVASAAHVLYHAQIVSQKATARELIHISNETIALAYDESQDVSELMNGAEGRIFELSQRAQKRDVTQIDPVIQEAFARMRKASETEGDVSGVPSGFTELDKVTSGWQKSDLIIIAARPAMGKTAFVLSMVKNIAVDFGRPVAMFSLEMSNVQLVNRLIQNVCEIDGKKIRNGDLDKADWSKLNHRVTEMMGAPVYVDDTPSLSVFELRSKARKLVREHKVEMIIIDYLQLMNASGMSFGSREQEVSTISRNLKGLAKELDIPIIALSQLNRGVENRGTGGAAEGKEPQLSDLRESGAIEQDADMVCFIHRPEYYMRKSGGESIDPKYHALAQIIIAKHRNGATKTVELTFTSEFARFENRTKNAYGPVDGATLNGGYTSVGSKINSMDMSNESIGVFPSGDEDRPF